MTEPVTRDVDTAVDDGDLDAATRLVLPTELVPHLRRTDLLGRGVHVELEGDVGRDGAHAGHRPDGGCGLRRHAHGETVEHDLIPTLDVSVRRHTGEARGEAGLIDLQRLAVPRVRCGGEIELGIARRGLCLLGDGRIGQLDDPPPRRTARLHGRRRSRLRRLVGCTLRYGSGVGSRLSDGSERRKQSERRHTEQRSYSPCGTPSDRGSCWVPHENVPLVGCIRSPTGMFRPSAAAVRHVSRAAIPSRSVRAQTARPT